MNTKIVVAILGLFCLKCASFASVDRQYLDTFVDIYGGNFKEGSGFAIGPTTVLTACHVVNNTKTINIVDLNNRRYIVRSWECINEDVAVLETSKLVEYLDSDSFGDTQYNEDGYGCVYGKIGESGILKLCSSLLVVGDDIYYNGVFARAGMSGGPCTIEVNNQHKVVGVISTTGSSTFKFIKCKRIK